MNLHAEQTKTYKWMYQGNYVLGELLSDLCSRTGCSLGLSGEVVELPVTLSVKTSSPHVLLSAIRLSVAASGYYLSGTLKDNLTVQKDLQADVAVFIDHQNNVQVVPKRQLETYKKADSLRALVPQTVSRRWRFDFMSVSDVAAKSYGFEVSHPLANGSFDFTRFLEKQHLSDGWNFDYLAQMDSLFEHRSVSFDLDSSVSFSWGTQKQVLDKTFIQEGIQTNNYVWRQYGIEINITSYPKMKMSYTLRSPDESTITGSTMLGQDSLILVVAAYDLNQHGERCFLPWLPIFCKPSFQNEKRWFVLRLFRQEDRLLLNQE